jgi:tRNA-Thr(GGU) m(6)t(6)A37 methyltransferase TsaA
MIQAREQYSVHPVGHIRSTLRALDEAPRQGSEGAPDAWLEVNPTFARGLSGIATGDELVVITWFHRADRDILEVHPRSDPEIPLAGVFATRSPHRPNPLGLHRVTVREISGTRLRIGPIEAIDGTPVVGVGDALGLDQHSIACGFDDPPFVLGDGRIDELEPVGPEPREGARLVAFHQSAVSDHVGRRIAASLRSSPRASIARVPLK